MSKASKPDLDDDLLPEYDFSSMAGAVRGKYYERYRAGVNLVLLEPEVARAFPTDRAVNDALKTVMRATKAPRRRTRLSNNRYLDSSVKRKVKSVHRRLPRR